MSPRGDSALSSSAGSFSLYVSRLFLFVSSSLCSAATVGASVTSVGGIWASRFVSRIQDLINVFIVSDNLKAASLVLIIKKYIQTHALCLKGVQNRAVHELCSLVLRFT